MDYTDLLDRIGSKDSDAFLDLTERYGWSVYSVIREKYPDHAAADKIYNETMNLFYHRIADASVEDPLEALLCLLAELIAEKETQFCRDHSDLQLGTAAPAIYLDNKEERSNSKHRKKNKFWIGLVMFLVLSIMAAVIWCGIGVMMSMDYIPYCDLGYSWFNANIIQFF